MDSEIKSATVKSSDQIDLLVVFNILKKKKRLYYLPLCISVILGIIIAFSIPKSYKTEVVLAPELMSSSSISSSLSDIASMVGINFKNSGSSYDAIYPEIYPQIISSTPFLTSMFNVHVTSEDKKIKNITLYDYLNKEQKAAWWDVIKIALIKLVKKKKPTASSHKLDTFKMTEAEFETARAIRGLIKCSVDKKTSIITLSFTAQDPVISASVADTIQKKLQEYVTEYRTKKARVDLDYALKLYDEAKAQYIAAQQRYAKFSDANEDLILQSFKVKKDDLENEMQLQYNIYNQVAQQVQMARAKVQENTPAFTQIQPAVVPLKKDAPKRMTIILGFMFLSVFLTTGYILVQDSRNNKTAKQIS